MSLVLLGLAVWGVLALLLLGWLAPLIIGLRRRRRGTGGKVLTGVGAVWCLLALGLVGMGVRTYYAFRHDDQQAAFDADAYEGALGTLAFPYEGAGSLSFRCESPDGASHGGNAAVTNGIVRVPAGKITLHRLSVALTNSGGAAGGTLTCSFASKNESFKLETNGQHRVAGGFPLTASIKAESQGEKLSLNFSMADTAGNKVAWYAAGAGRTPPSFEAVEPSGKCFWRDKFEYG
jgi:hypothetical protein